MTRHRGLLLYSLGMVSEYTRQQSSEVIAVRGAKVFARLSDDLVNKQGWQAERCERVSGPQCKV